MTDDRGSYAGPGAGADVARDSAAEESTEQEAPSLRFASVAEFVEVYLSRIYARETSGQGQRWCSEWWKHGEAIARLEALWRSWEVARLDPGDGASNWWLGHADPHMRVLLSEDGPFRHCKGGAHSSARSGAMTLAVTPAPRSLFGEPK